jgi:hypothetical protein
MKRPITIRAAAFIISFAYCRLEAVRKDWSPKMINTIPVTINNN